MAGKEDNKNKEKDEDKVEIGRGGSRTNRGCFR